MHVAVETAEQADPAKRKLGDLVWHAGTYDLRRDFAPGGVPSNGEVAADAEVARGHVVDAAT